MARTLLPREPSQGEVLAKFMGTRVTAPCRGTGPQGAAGLNPAQLTSQQTSFYTFLRQASSPFPHS